MNKAGGWCALVVACAACHVTSATSPMSASTTTPSPVSADTTSPSPSPQASPAPSPQTAPSPTPSPSGGSDPQLVTVPDVMGKFRDDAVATLERAGLKAVIRNDEGSVNFTRAKVCSESPGGGRETRASLPVSIQFCDNTRRPMRERIELVGLTIEQATKRAHDAGFTGRIEVIESTGSACTMGTVCEAAPPGWDIDLPHVLRLYTPKKLDIKAPE